MSILFTKKNRKYLILALILIMIASIVLIFDLWPFKVSQLSDSKDIEEIRIEKYILKPGIELVEECLGEVDFTEMNDIDEVYNILSKYSFRRHLFQPDGGYTTNIITEIRLKLIYRSHSSFYLTIIDYSSDTITDFPNDYSLYIDRNGGFPQTKYSIDLFGNKQQAELYNALDALIVDQD